MTGRSLSQRLIQVVDLVQDTLPTTTGDSIHLYRVLERAQVVLLFLVKAFRLECTAEARRFRDPTILGLLPGRAALVIGQDRMIRQVIVGNFQAGRHIRKSLKALRMNV